MELEVRRPRSRGGAARLPVVQVVGVQDLRLDLLFGHQVGQLLQVHQAVVVVDVVVVGGGMELCLACSSSSSCLVVVTAADAAVAAAQLATTTTTTSGRDDDGRGTQIEYWGRSCDDIWQRLQFQQLLGHKVSRLRAGEDDSFDLLVRAAVRAL